MDHIYGTIKKNYKHGNDFVKYLRTGDEDQCGNAPTRKIASQVTLKGDKKGEFETKVEQDGYDIEYTDDLREYKERK